MSQLYLMEFTSIINTFILIGTLFVGVIYLFVFLKRGASTASIESNVILRGLIDDQKEEITKLRQRLHDQDNTLTALSLQVQILIDRRDYLETLVTQALGAHFLADPALAAAAEKLVMQSKAKTVSDTKK